MSRRFRVLAAGAALIASLTIGAAPALAAAPSNDTLAGATVVTALPFDDTLDTRAATTDSIDAQANAGCGAPVTLASVWYDFTPTADDGYIVDVSQSDYSAGVIVVTGDPGSFQIQACGPGTIAFSGSTGTTYHIVAFSDTVGVNGGTLRFHMEVAPPPPELTVSVDPVGHVNQRTGVATLTGHFTCSGVADFTDINGQLTQAVGRFSITGSFDFFVSPVTCDGSVQTWSATVFPSNGKFAGGKSASVAFAFACNIFFCSDTFTEQKVQLRR